MTDTLSWLKEAFPNMRCSLDGFAERFNIDASKRDINGALLDAELLSQVYCKLIQNKNSISLSLNLGCYYILVYES